MLTKEFLCKREVLGKRSPHSFTPPSKCGRCVQQYQRKKEKVKIEDHSIKITKGKESPKTLECIISKCDLKKNSNEGNKLCVDVGKKEDHEDISNEGKEP
jgi:hypothetical protein